MLQCAVDTQGTDDCYVLLSQKMDADSNLIKVRSVSAWPVRDSSHRLLSTCKDIWEGGASERRRRTATFVALYYCTIAAVTVSAADWRSNDTLAIHHTNRLSRYRHLHDGGVWYAQPTLDMDPVRGTHARSTVAYVFTHR